MVDVRQWLDSLGLGRYGDAFARNDIEADLLPDLTDERLQALGVGSVGHRMRILKAVEELAVALPEVDPARGDVSPRSAATGEVERRQLTVLFCDLVGSVALAERMDVEDYRDLLGRFRAVVVAAIERHRGFVARHQGDGLLAYFGYPQAREDDAERAVRAGLEVVRDVAHLEETGTGAPGVRVGIATGPAVVGDVLATGASDSAELAALGRTPNLAARLQGVAERDRVVVSQTTARLVTDLFRLDAMADVHLKGLSTPVTAYRVLGERAATRSQALMSARLSPLVGREGELGLIGARWEQARRGEGQAVLVCAEPGVGKTRLLQEARDRLRDERPTAVSLYCSAYHVDSSLQPVVEALARRLGSGGGTVRLEDVRAWLGELGFGDDRSVRLLAAMLALPLAGPETALGVSPEQIKRQTLELLVGILERMSRRRPVLLLAEDLHWADPTTLEYLGQVLERVRDQRILVLLTFRPGFTPPWPPQPHLSSLTLNHLSIAECERLARVVLGPGDLSNETIASIVARADGIPLFVEELSRAVRDSGREAGAAAGVPATLRDALMARLDQLGPAKGIAQLAAVIGRQFRLDWLSAAATRPEEVAAALDVLVAAGLVYGRGSPPWTRFEFKHALVRDVAYDTLLRAERQRLHGNLAAVLIDAEPDLEVQPGIVAFHLQQAGQPERALPFILEAATLAAARGAHAEALSHYEAGLGILDEAGERSPRLLDALVGKAASLHFLGRREEAARLLVEREADLADVDDPARRGRFYHWRGQIQAFLGHREEARHSLLLARSLAERAGDEVLEADVHFGLGMDGQFRGELQESVASYERAIALLAARGDTSAYGLTLVYAGYTYMFLGRYGDARRVGEEGLAIARRLSDPLLRANAEFLLGWHHVEVGDFQAAFDILAPAIRDAPSAFDEAILSLAWALGIRHTAPREEAIETFERTRQKVREYRSVQVQVYLLIFYAEAMCDFGREAAARELAEEALDLATRIEAKGSIARLQSILGTIAESSGELATASGLLQQAETAQARSGYRSDLAMTLVRLAAVHRRRRDLPAARRCLQRAFELCGEMGLPHRTRRIEEIARDYGLVLGK